jgi:hypothetical protein
MMARAVELRPHFSSDTAHILFTGSYVHAGRDYETDGRRFLLIKSPRTKRATSLQVVLGWTSELEMMALAALNSGLARSWRALSQGTRDARSSQQNQTVM